MQWPVLEQHRLAPVLFLNKFRWAGASISEIRTGRSFAPVVGTMIKQKHEGKGPCAYLRGAEQAIKNIFDNDTAVLAFLTWLSQFLRDVNICM